jgi:hypothetical protein
VATLCPSDGERFTVVEAAGHLRIERD